MAERAAPVLGTDEKRRLVRRLLDTQGRGLAEACGLAVTNNPANLFGVLCLAQLHALTRDYRRAAALARALRRHWDTPGRLAAAGREDLVEVLAAAGAARGAARLAGLTGDLARTVVRRYRGDLRRLRSEAGREPRRERELLLELPGIDTRAVDVFLREIQVLWPELRPYVDRQVLRAAARLGLGGRVPDLVALTGDESEKLAWLAGALARVDEDGSYAEVRPLAAARA